ncbi:MAG: hotdog fold thioesterase [Flavobacteriales bacterium]
MAERSEAQRIVDQMYNNDPMSKWLGIVRVEDAPGVSVLRMHVRAEMLNGFGIAHGGICYALADSALAFASNAHGVQSVSIETSISHVMPVQLGDELTTRVKEVHLTKRTGLYQIEVFNQREQVVAFFKGTVFRTDKRWEV